MAPNQRLSRLPAAVLSLLAATLTACVDAPITAPDDAAATGPSLTRLEGNGALPALIPNTTKYRSSGKRNGTGRDGGYTLTARALFDRSGTTTLDVTTGELDVAATGPATFAKVQVKGLDPNDLGEALWVKNYNSLRNAQLAQYSYTYPGLAPGLPLQVQANMSGIGKRTGVVTVVEYVKLRPDLAATSLMAPERVTRGLPVNITATISELNGDVGARANCILYVDGVEADRALGIWVDAGGTVSCAFTQVFETLGTRALRISVEGVTPGDWDDANNSVTGSLEVVIRNDFTMLGVVRDSLSLVDRQYDYFHRGTDGTNNWILRYGDGTHHVVRKQSVLVTGNAARESTFPFSSIELSESSGSQSLVSFVFVDVKPTRYWDYTYPEYVARVECSYLFTDQAAVGHVYLTVCLTRNTWLDNTTTFSTEFTLTRSTSSVSYLSTEYSHYWYNGVEVHSYVYNDGWQTGPPLPEYAEDLVAFRTVFTSSSGTYTAAIDVPLVTVSWGWNREYACLPEQEMIDGTTIEIYQVCFKDISRGSTRNGLARADPSDALIP